MRTARIRVRDKATGAYLSIAGMSASAEAPAAPAPTAAHQGASIGRRMGGWRPSSIGPNAIVAAEGPELIRRARDLVRNNAHARRAIGLYGTHIVGTGIKPRSLCSNKRVREAIHRLWADWTDHADADGAFDFYGLQTQAVREMATTGEEFARLRARRSTDGLPVPLQIQLIPAEQVPLDHTTQHEGRQVVQGVERDALGRRLAYLMYRVNPGDAGVTMDVNGWEKVRVDAADVCHLRFAPPNQLRGLPWLASVITTLHQLGQWRDAALLRKQLIASLVGFVKRAVTEEMDAAKIAEMWGAVQEEFGDLPAVGLEPGTMQYLQPGEDVTFTQWQETAGQDEVFERAGLRTVAAGLDLVYEELSGDWEKTNDRTFRAAFNTMKRTMAQYQHQVLAHQFNRPIWHRWLDAAVASGALRAPKSVTEADLRRVEWQPQDWEYLQPVQDVEAKLKAIAGGLDSRTNTVARRGDDVEVIDAQRAADAERERALKIAPAAQSGPEPQTEAAGQVEAASDPFDLWMVYDPVQPRGPDGRWITGGFKVGPLNVAVLAELLGIRIAAGNAVVPKPVHIKLATKHRNEYVLVKGNLKRCLSRPHYVGHHPDHPGKVDFVLKVKGLPGNNVAIQVPVTISADRKGNYRVVSGFAINQSRLDGLVTAGHLTKA